MFPLKRSATVREVCVVECDVLLLDPLSFTVDEYRARMCLCVEIKVSSTFGEV